MFRCSYNIALLSIISVTDEDFALGEPGLAGAMQGLPDRLSAGSMSEPGGPAVACGPGKKADPPPASQQLMYVFTTSLANR